MREIRLTNGMIAKVDDADYAIVAPHRWSHSLRPRTGKCYAMTSIEGRTTYMHRLITAAERGQDVDHINDDGLDNQRSNLRVCTRSQNIARRRTTNGSSGMRGACHVRQGRWEYWVSRIWVRGRKIALGCFKTRDEAARAYDAAARKYFGEFARLNFPDREPSAA